MPRGSHRNQLAVSILAAQVGLVGCLAGGPPALARGGGGGDPGSPKESRLLKSKVTSVAVFKNGTAHFVRETRLKGSGWFHTEPPPAAILGSLWVSAQGVRVNGLLARRHLGRQARPCRSFHEVLDRNPGMSVRLYLKDKRVVEGTVVFPTQPTKLDTPGPAFSPSFVTVKSSDGYVMLPRDQILRVEYKTLPKRMCVDRVQQHHLYFHARGARAGAVVRTLYVQRGLQWTPTYRLVRDGGTARLAMQAVVVNRREALQNTELKLVVGVPNLVNEGHLSPLALDALKVRQGHSVSHWRRYSSWRNEGRYRAQSFSNVRRGASARGSLGSSGAAGGARIYGQGARAGNLYVYNVGRISLRTGERATVPVMSGRFPVKRIYRWEPGPAQEKEAWHRRRFRSVQQQMKDRVWEYLELKNTSRVPLTTGPVMLTQGGQLLGQDVLRYTPPGGRSEVPVNVATNVLSTQVKSELSRRVQAKRIKYRWYSSVTYQVTLKIVNHERHSIQVKVRKSLTGRVLSAPGAAQRQTGRGGAVNPTSQITYDAAVPAGKHWKQSFTISVYE